MLLKLTARGIECFQVELEGRDRWTEDDRASECPTWVCWNLESIVFRWLISSWNSCWIDCFSLSVCDWRWRKRESWLSNCSIDDASERGLLLRGLTSLTALLRAAISASCDERIVRLWSIYKQEEPIFGSYQIQGLHPLLHQFQCAWNVLPIDAASSKGKDFHRPERRIDRCVPF